MNTPAIIAAAVVLAAAWYWDSRSWRRKQREELVRMIQGDDWRFHKPAIQELRRRGEDLAPYLPYVVALLVADTKVERAAAHITIKDCFPHLVTDIRGYSASANVEVCRIKAGPLLSRFPLPS